MEELNKAIGNILEVLRSVPLSDGTVNGYKEQYRYIYKYCESGNIIAFLREEAETFTDMQMSRWKEGQIGERQFRKLRRSAYLLANCMQGEKIIWKSAVFPPRSLEKHFAGTLKDFETSLLPYLASGTINVMLSAVRKFLFFLEDIGLRSFDHLEAGHLRKYVESVADNHQGSMADLVWHIRKFILFLNEAGQSTLDAGKIILRPAPSKKKALPCFTAQESDAILSAVDTATALGKRDYAILKLALGTGLRGVDIFGLELTDIDWRKNEIALAQSKTGEAIHLPLMADVGNAIADYILHGRPKSDSPHIFLRIVKPHVRLGSIGNGKNIISRYLSKAGVMHEAWDGKTFHAFRRTQGTRLLEAGVPLPDVAAMLGQLDIDSPKRYISNDEAKMRECCLDISEFATQKEGLS